jgi:hypothetical protein
MEDLESSDKTNQQEFVDSLIPINQQNSASSLMLMGLPKMTSILKMKVQSRDGKAIYKLVGRGKTRNV